MLLITIHPVIAMHFCGGEFHSLNFYTADNEHDCCHINVPVVEEKADACCAAEESTINIETDIEKFTQQQNSCCEFQIIKVQTDDFQYQIENINLNQTHISFENNLFLLSSLFSDNNSETNLYTSETDFPPQGLFTQYLSLMNLCCVYRL